MLRLDAVVLRRGRKTLLGPLSAELPAGTVTHLRGPNGVGKTTLIHAIVGLREPDAGQVCWQGSNVFEHPEPLRESLCYVAHDATGNPALTPVESLRFVLALNGEGADAASDALREIGLKGRTLTQPIRTLSAGQQRRVALARLAVTKAPLWVLDEPLNALDDAARSRLCQRFREHASNGGTVVVTSHQALPIDADCIDLVAV